MLVSVGPPALGLSLGNGTLQLSWPAWTTNYSYQLYCTTDLIAPVVWVPVTNSVVNAGDNLSVTLPIGPGSRFFQLR
jgi:hypothetical protein